MRSTSSRAAGPMSTRNLFGIFKLAKEFLQGPGSSLANVFQPLIQKLAQINEVDVLVVRFFVENDHWRMAVCLNPNGLPGLADLLHKRCRIALQTLARVGRHVRLGWQI